MGTVTLSAQQPKAGVELTASVTDIDGAPAGVTWVWERDDDAADDPDNVSTGEEVIKGATSASYTPDDEDDVDKHLRAIATYTDPQGSDTAKATSVNDGPDEDGPRPGVRQGRERQAVR